MRNRSRVRGRSKKWLGVNILTVTNDGAGHAVFTTKWPHGLKAGDGVTVTGCSVTDYNQTWDIGSVTANTFTPTGNETYTSDSTGGTWSKA